MTKIILIIFAKKIMTKFYQFYKDNIGKNVTKTIIGSLITTIVSLGGFILFNNIPEKEEIQKEFTNHFEGIQKNIEQNKLYLERLKASENLFINYGSRQNFILSLSQKFEIYKPYNLTVSEIEKVKVMLKQNLMDYGLNSAILANYKIEEDKQLNEALKSEKEILQTLNDQPKIDKIVYHLIADYRINTKKFVEFSLMQNRRIIGNLEKEKTDDKKYKEIEKKFKWNNTKLIISSELIVFCSFLIIIIVITAVKIGHLKD